jgi:hypothetical protein
VFKFIDTHKGDFGFANFDVEVIDASDVEHQDSLAVTEILPGALKLRLTLFHGWDEDDSRDWQKIVLHELLHARIGLVEDQFREQTQRLRYFIEEQCIDDIAHGLRKYYK